MRETLPLVVYHLQYVGGRSDELIWRCLKGLLHHCTGFLLEWGALELFCEFADGLGDNVVLLLCEGALQEFLKDLKCLLVLLRL